MKADTGTEIGQAFIEESNKRVAAARGWINHCLDQLSEEDIWWSASEGCNCVGGIVQHLLGNLRQWVLSALTGLPDTRDRPREFCLDPRLPKSALEAQLDGMLDQVAETYSAVDPSSLLDVKRIQGQERSVLSAMYGTVNHLEQHAAQIAFIAKVRLGPSYRPRVGPQPEQKKA